MYRQVYLPRDWSHRTSNQRPRILVANPNLPQRTKEDRQATSFALLSLLREGGQWDYEDDLQAAGVAGVSESLDSSHVDFSQYAKDAEGGIAVFENAVILERPEMGTAGDEAVSDFDTFLNFGFEVLI
jgi:hypothetical protein